MGWVLAILIAGAAGMVVFSLVRGLIYFAKTGEAIQKGGEAEAEFYLAQNRMMFARVKWQALAIGLLVLIGLLGASAK